MPLNNGEFAQRLASVKQRIDALQVRLADAELRQSAYLERVAVRELEQQKDRLAAYEVQARFALATMYDRAANAEAGHKAPLGPVQKGAEGEEAGKQAPAPATAPQPVTPPPTGEPPR